MSTQQQKKILEEVYSSTNDVAIDLGNYGAACETINIDGLNYTDTITLDPSITTITLPPSTYSGSGWYSTITSTGTSFQPTWTSTTAGYNIGGISPSPATVNIDSNGINIKEGGDLTINGRSLGEFMTKMEQRLAILVPDPNKLQKFEALKKAYEHYKTMESLCFDEPEEEKK